MYWYVKYPLIAILVLAAIGITVLVWRSVRGGAPSDTPPDDPEQVVVMPPEIPDPPENTDNNRPTTPTVGDNSFRALETQLARAEEQLRKESPGSARQLAKIAMKMDGCVEFDRYWFRAFDIINEANRRFMNSTAPCPEKLRYTVQPGDTLGKIANQHYTSVDALVRLNGLSKDRAVIHPQQVVSYLTGTWRIRVNKQHYVLILYRDNEPYRYYRVSIGREDRTPAGTFFIKSRIAHPAWTPSGKNIPYGDPQNVLGTHWLGLTPTGDTDPTLTSYGIHGTWEPESIGHPASAGCVRMLNEEVEELFDFIPEPGTCPPVQVLIEE